MYFVAKKVPDAMSTKSRIQLFGIEIDAVRMPQAVARVYEWIRDRAGGCRFVVTPNVDHTVLLQSHAALRQAYRDAGLVLADGFPVVWAAKFLGQPLPETVTGSDLVPALFNEAEAHGGLRVFLLGAGPGVANIAATRIMQRWEHVNVVGTYSPPLGFEHKAGENEKIVALVNESQADVLVIGFGAPKQELWIERHAKELHTPAALCVGATIDFLAGEKSRAPVWMRKCRLEWLHRLCSEPRRLVRRYVRDAWIFPQLVWREWRNSHQAA